MHDNFAFRSDMTVSLTAHVGSDVGSIVRAARVSLNDIDIPPEGEGEYRGLINYLMKHRHGSPFEHNSLTFYVEAPIFVAREFMRHRIGWSYNEMSGRYTELEPVFYIPSDSRPLRRVGTPARPVFAPINWHDQAMVQRARHSQMAAYKFAWREYRYQLLLGIAPEVARNVLPVGIFTKFFATCNARSLMSFLSLRVSKENNQYATYPQLEIEMVAKDMETHLAELFPMTYDAFEANGRVSP